MVPLGMFGLSSPERVTDGVYLVGSSELTDSRDCSVYLVDAGELLLVDSGAGVSAAQVAKNIELLGLDPALLSTLILTHCHIDHVGGAAYFKERFGVRIIMHALDARPVENGDPTRTGASWYGLRLAPLPVDVKLEGIEETLSFRDGKIEELGGWLSPDLHDLLVRHQGWGIQARQGALLFYRKNCVYHAAGRPTLLALAWQLREMLRKGGGSRSTSAC